jgi:hypothetical protein
MEKLEGSFLHFSSGNMSGSIRLEVMDVPREGDLGLQGLKRTLLSPFLENVKQAK